MWIISTLFTKKEKEKFGCVPFRPPPFLLFFNVFCFLFCFLSSFFHFFGVFVFLSFFCSFSEVRKISDLGVIIFSAKVVKILRKKKKFPLSLLLADLTALKETRKISPRSLEFRSNSFRKLPYLKSFFGPRILLVPLFFKEGSEEFLSLVKISLEKNFFFRKLFALLIFRTLVLRFFVLVVTCLLSS